MIDDIGRTFGMRRDRRVGVLRLQLQQLGFAERLVDDAHARPPQHVAPELAVHIAAEMPVGAEDDLLVRSEEHTSELQSLMRISYAVFCLQKKNTYIYYNKNNI